jgi:uncharacterized LabA/DUF88 family protein
VRAFGITDIAWICSPDPRFAPAMGDEMPRDGTTLALFIDGANAHATAKALGFDIDYKRLLTEFQSRGTLVRAFYYTATFEDREYFSVRPLIDWLDYNGFTVVTKPAKEFEDGEGRRKFKRSSMGVELAVDALEIANQVDNIVLFSGDGDFCSLLEAVQRQGVHVSVISSLLSKPPIIADELRRQADTFIELDDLKAAIGRTLNAVPPRSALG